VSAVRAPVAATARRRGRDLLDRVRALGLAHPRLTAVVGVTALVVVSALLRSTALRAHYWIDEGLSVGIASHPFADVPGLLRQDGSPPLYYLLLSLWVHAFGDGEARTHVLSLLFALATVPAAFLAGRSLFGVRAGWVAALLAAINPFLTYYAQETRMYSLVALVATVVAWTFGEAFVRRRRRWAPAFGVALALLAYAHNWGLLLGVGSVAALALLAARSAGAERRGLLRDAAVGYGVAALLYLPWVPTLLFQARHTGAPWSETPDLGDIQVAMSQLLGGAAPAMAFTLGAGAGFFALAVAWWGARTDRRGAAAVAIFVMGFVAIVLAFVLSLVSPAWANRYFAVVAGPLMVLGGAGLVRAGRLGLVVLALLLVFWLDPRTAQLTSKSNAHRASVYMRQVAQPGDLAVVMHPESGPLMHLYLRPGLRWANAMGPVPDPAIFDWRDAVERLQAAKPKATSNALIDTMRSGQHLLLVQPIIRTASWGAPWTKLVRLRAAQWEHRLDDDPRLLRLMSRPILGSHPVSRGVRIVVYERR
jgi:4-amino-4-deoxy-L-arabinose transferase-like glycosyltransferase